MKRASKKSNCTNRTVIHLFSICLTVLFLASTRVYALDPLGPPVSDIQKWQLTAGFEYSLNSLDFELVNGQTNEAIAWVPSYNGALYDSSIDNVETTKLNVYLGYGLDRNVEAFARLGAASAEFGKSELEPTGKFDSDYSPSIGAGLRMTFIEERQFKIGAIAQASWAEYNGTINPSRWISQDNITMNVMEAQIALGALYQWTNYMSFYGGPFYHYATGEFEAHFLYNDPVNFQLTTADDKWDIEVSSKFGGYLGTCITLVKNMNLNFEYQMTGSANALSAGIVCKF